MAQFHTREDGDVAIVTFDSGGMNTLSRAAIEELERVEADIRARHARTRLAGVVLLGNRYGLGAGANIGELMHGSAADLTTLIDRGNAVLFRIEEGPVPWVAAFDADTGNLLWRTQICSGNSVYFMGTVQPDICQPVCWYCWRTAHRRRLHKQQYECVCGGAREGSADSG